MNTGERISSFQNIINKRKSIKDLNYLTRPGGDEPYEHKKVNSLGYRGPEFNSNNDFLFLGCSQTWGYALEEEEVWPKFLCDKINKTYSNISSPGDSVQSQVIKAFAYFKEFGNPKYIVGIFPFARFEFPYISDRVIFKSLQSKPVHDKNQPTKVYFADMFIPYDLNSTKFEKNFSKTPHDVGEIFPIELAVYYNNIFISMLEQYCESNNIDLLWSFWEAIDPVTDSLLKERYKSYFSFPLEMHNQLPDKQTIKNEYFEELENKYKLGNNFRVASDNCHFGVGKHIFIADEVYSKLKL